MSSNNIYNILGKLDALAPKAETPKETAQKIYESVEANGSITEGVKGVETKLNEKYMGWKKTVAAVTKGGSAEDPEAVAAAIGRKKYGKAKFQKAAAAGKKLGESDDYDDDDYYDDDYCDEDDELNEKWGTATKVSPEEKGKYAGKTKAELLKSYNALKKSGPHKKDSKEYGRMRELAFAIRAKSDWGKVAEETVDEVAAPGQEDWIKKNKQHFIDQYGKEKGMSVLYATAWKRHRDAKKGIDESSNLREIGKIEHGDRKAIIYKDMGWNEYRVEFFSKGKHHAGAEHQTEDKRDAIGIAKNWVNPSIDLELTESQKAKKAGILNEGINFRRMAEEVGMTLEEMLECLSKDMHQYKSTGHMTEILRDCMEVFSHGKRQLADESQKETVNVPAVVPSAPTPDSGTSGESDMHPEPSLEEELNELARLAGLQEDTKSKPDFLDVDKDGDKEESWKKAEQDKEEKKVDECMSPMGSAPEQQDKLSVNTNMDSDGHKSVTVNAEGEQAEALLQILKMAGLGDSEKAQHAQAIVVAQEAKKYGDTDVEEAPEYANKPDPETEDVDAIIHQGNDLNREKKQYAGKPKAGDNPMASESVNLLDALGRRLMRAYESIKLNK